jgi:hypothetical protein
VDIDQGEGSAGTSEPQLEARSHFRYQLWSNAAHGFGSRATGSHRYGAVASSGMAYALDDPNRARTAAPDSGTAADTAKIP